MALLLGNEGTITTSVCGGVRFFFTIGHGVGVSTALVAYALRKQIRPDCNSIKPMRPRVTRPYGSLCLCRVVVLLCSSENLSAGVLGTCGITSIYLAPKLPFRAIHWVRGKVYGKTVVLAVVWLFTTLLLPIWAHRFSFSSFDLNYIFYRFLLFLLVCFFFDYRDRESDRAGGIHSFLVHQPLPYLHRFVVVVLGLALWLNWNMKEDIDTLTFLLQMLPLVLLFAFRHKSFQTQSDSWYYLFLDAMVFLVPLCTWLRTLH
jgi:hypothetical protein